MMVQQKSRKRILACLSIIGTLILIGAFVFIGCEEAPSPSPRPSPNSSPIDSDGDMLIDIQNLDMLAHIRYNLTGTSYKTSASDSGMKCGANRETDCMGYELVRDLDFAVAGDYASGSVNMEWRPTMGGSVVAPSSTTNSGWRPLGNDTRSFRTLFEGNGRSISNLYSRNTENADARRTGLFGQLGTRATLRNLLIADGNVYGGTRSDRVGIAVGVNEGTIANVAVRGGSAHGDNGRDDVGGLVGWSSGTIVASASTAATYGDDGGVDDVGGLVGEVNGGSVTASYASGAVDGGAGNEDHVGGLVGRSHGAVRASYATGSVNAHNGTNDVAGGLVGLQNADATIVASYATGNIDGGAGADDNVGKLVGNAAGTTTASYGFGITIGGETVGNDGGTLPSGANTIAELTMPGTTSPPDTAAPAEWQDAASHTMGAWDFGSTTRLPTLRYADYDGSDGTDYCVSFSNVPGTDMAITCGTTLLSGQGSLHSLPPFDLTVSAAFAANTGLAGNPATLTATVRNHPISRPSPVATLRYYRSDDSRIDDGDTALTETDTIPVLNSGATDTQDITITLPATPGDHYYYACVVATNEADTSNNCSPVITIEVIAPIDSDNDMLIEIQNLDMLYNIRYNFAGTSYKTSASDSGLQCGTDATAACMGYELMRDLDFAVASDYASGSVNMEWRPTAGGSIVASDNATNSGWPPIGIRDFANLTTLFEGNGRSISNLYTRNTANINSARVGLFGQLSVNGVIRNLLIADSNVYGGSRTDHIGIAVGLSSGTISNVAVRGGSAHGGGDTDDVGGLVGWGNRTIVASSSTAAVYGDEGANDDVGGLVGRVSIGTITASYASGAVDGGTGNVDSVGGLVGRNHGTIRASYARGDVTANDGDNEAAGGLVGLQFDSQSTIIASYATGNVDGGIGVNDRVGQLTGTTIGTITASYGFGTLSGAEVAGNDGVALPNGANTIAELTMPVAANPPNTAAPAEWQDAASHTMNAWNFGTNAQAPALRYADYDGRNGTDYCPAFSNIPGTSTAITCGTTLLSGQGSLRSLPPFDLTVSATASANTVLARTSITLNATVRNRQSAFPSATTTLTYYRSDDNMIDNSDTTIGTDTIPAISSGATDTHDVTVTLPGTTDAYYYYACVAAGTNEANTSNNCSDVVTIQVVPPIDSDNDTLIDITNLDMLYNIRYNLAGDSYSATAGESTVQCGAGSTTACTGYELMNDLDFAVAGSYASGSVNMEWRPTAGGSVVAPGSAINRGWEPIGTGDAAPFATLFEGNGRSISNLYSRNTANSTNGRTGLFGQLNASGTLRNLLIADSNVYGGSSHDHIGIAVGRNHGTISNVAVRGGSAHGNNGADDVGGLVGWSEGTIIASSAASTTAVYGDSGGNDDVGGLVGAVTGGTITASYASGAVEGGGGSEDHVGGLVGNNSGTIRASYARGDVDANDGNREAAGGLVGLQHTSATITASYATGNVDGGSGLLDNVGRLTGNTSGTITASYAFGTTSGGEVSGSDGATLPAGASTIAQLTIPVAANPPNTAAPAQWQDAASHTMNAWDFGNNTQAPALRYADYDGTGGTDYCAAFSNVPGTSTDIVCGTTLLPGQR